ncbi:MAG: MBL fold metallo-hydrolase [Gemmatimonadota bacterium]|nr:MAG: MBL fold metallo-hydrolase [Gemmatimonadota bacterium]
MTGRYFNRRAAVFVGLIVSLSGSSALAQSNGGSSIELQRQGMEVVEAAITATGGRAAIMSANTVELLVSTEVYSLGQGVRPDADATVGDGGPITLRYLIDIAGDRHVYEQVLSDTANQPRARLVVLPDEIFVYTPARNIVQPVVDMTPLRPLTRGLPYVPATLLDATDHAASIRLLGDKTIAGTAYRVVTYADGSNQQVALYFDRQTRLLGRSEIVESHEQLGDHVVEIVYDDYRTVGALRIPHKISVYTAGTLATVSEFNDVDLAATMDAALLIYPDSANQLPALTGPVPSPEMEVTELSDGIYAIMNATAGYNLMFVDHGDHVFVIEAPISTAITRAVLQKIDETLPGKPVRYAMITHYHYDHSGGLWGFMTNGTTIVTTPGIEQFVYDVAAVPRTLDCEPPLGARPGVELVRENRTFGSGDTAVEVYDVSPNPHADELLIAYLPALKLMYVADVYNYTGQIQQNNELLLPLADKLEELGLEIERVLPTHGQEATGETFWESVRLGREGS